MNRHGLFFAVCFATTLGVSTAHAYCRRTSPAWTDSNPVRVVLHPEAHNFLRHVFVDPATGLPNAAFACTASSQCGSGGLCAPGFGGGTPNRCFGPTWSRSELERAVQWVIGRINNETPADIPFVYLDLNNTATCQIDETCGDADRPWMNCFQSDTIVILPTECDDTAVVSGNWTGVQWIDNGGSGSRAKILRLRWSQDNGLPWEHTLGMMAQSMLGILLHEMGHALGLGHLANDFPDSNGFPYCVPNTLPNTPTPLCPVDPAPMPAWTAFGTCPLMHGDYGAFTTLGLNNQFYGFDDIEGLVGLYGLDSAPDTRLYEDCDLTTPSFAELVADDLPLITDMAAAPGLPLNAVGSLAIGGRRRDALFAERFQIYQWGWSSYSSVLVASIDTPGFRSSGPLGVSVSGTHRTLSSHSIRFSNDQRHWRRQVRVVRRAISGGGETTATLNPSAGSAADTAVPGVSAVYHAGTDSWIHLIRDANGQILMVAWRPVEGWSNVISTGIASFATPSMACSPNRCFIALVEVPSPLPATLSRQTRLQWTEGTFQWPVLGSATFTFNIPVTTSLYNVVSDPVVAVVQNPAGGWYYYVSTSWPQLSGSAWGTRILTYRRSEFTTGSTALLQMTPLLAHSPGISVQPTAAGTGVCAELFTSRSP